jgi:hypothetical protein
MLVTKWLGWGRPVGIRKHAYPVGRTISGCASDRDESGRYVNYSKASTGKEDSRMKTSGTVKWFNDATGFWIHHERSR